MYQLPHYSEALKQFPSAAFSAYLANAGHHHHPFAAAAAAAAAAAVSQASSFSIDNILASRPRLSAPLPSYYGSSMGNGSQAAADFYCKSL